MPSQRIPMTTVLLAIAFAFPVAAGCSDLTAQEAGLDSARRSKAVVDRAIDAMGGVDSLRSINGYRRVFEVLDHTPTQGFAPVPRDAQAGPILTRSRIIEETDLAAGRALRRTTGEIFGGQPLDFRVVTGDSSGFVANDLTRRMDPMDAADAKASFQRSRIRQPGVLVLAMLDNAPGMRYLGTVRENNRPLDVVSFGLAGTTYDVHFDSASGLPVRQSQVISSPSAGDYVFSLSYQDWRTVAGRKVPFREESRWGRTLVLAYDLVEMTFNPSSPDSSFLVPSDYAGPPARSQKLRELAPGVLVQEGQYNTMLVEFSTFFVVVEPGGGSGNSRRMIAAAAERDSTKPIRYVVVTHFHDDHISGIRPYAAIKATIITTADAERSIRTMLEHPPRLLPAGDVPMPRFELVRDRRSIVEGKQRLDLASVGPNAHAREMLIVFHPGARLLFEADMLDLDFPPGQAGLAGRDTRDLALSLTRLGWKPEIIVPVHGRVGQGAELDMALASGQRP